MLLKRSRSNMRSAVGRCVTRVRVNSRSPVWKKPRRLATPVSGSVNEARRSLAAIRSLARPPNRLAAQIQTNAVSKIIKVNKSTSEGSGWAHAPASGIGLEWLLRALARATRWASAMHHRHGRATVQGERVACRRTPDCRHHGGSGFRPRIDGADRAGSYPERHPCQGQSD